MIKGLAITPPVLGRISIGRVVEKHGKRLPEKDDQFTITTQVQNKDGRIVSTARADRALLPCLLFSTACSPGYRSPQANR